MNTFAYCARSFRKSVRRAAGVDPVTCPPEKSGTFDPARLGGHDFLYFKLHGLLDQSYWYGDDWLTALSADQIRQPDLSGAVVFVANCYLPDSPMLAALLEAGAKAVIGGGGQNYSRVASVAGADALGMWFRRWLQVGLPVPKAFQFSKRILKTQAKAARGETRKMLEDALAFEMYSRQA